MQSALPVILALTYPGKMTLGGREASGLSGVLSEDNRLSVLAPLVTMVGCGLANAIFIGPATTKIMRERKAQGRMSVLADLW